MGFLSGIGTALGFSNPAKAGRPYLDKIPGYGRGAYRPYIEAGRQVDPMLKKRYEGYLEQEPSGVYSRMGQDPTAFMNAILAQYSESPGAQYRRQQLGRESRAAASAGGYAGTEGDVRRRNEMIDALLGSDQQQYLQNVLGIQGAGLQGQQYLADKGLSGLEGISNRGYQASGALADYLGSAASQRAQSEIAGKQAQGANFSNFLGQILGAGSSMYGAYQGRKGLEAFGRGMPSSSTPTFLRAPGSPGAPSPYAGGSPSSFVWG